MASIRIPKNHLISSLLTTQERAKTVLSINLSGDIDKDAVWTVMLDCIFRSVSFSTIGKRKTYEIGCEGGRVKLFAHDSSIDDFIADNSIPVTYSNEMSISDADSVTVQPTVKAKQVEASIGKIDASGSKASKGANQFTYAAHPIAVIKDENEIEWRIDLPRAQFIDRDYLLGNFYLFLTVRWKGKVKKGELEVRPSELFFYTKKNRRIGSMKSLLMRLALILMETKKINFPNGLRFDYEIES